MWLCETWVQLGERAKAGHLLDAAVQLARGSPTWIVQASSFAAIAMASQSSGLRDTTAILAEAQSRVDDGDPATRSLAAATLAPALQTHDHDRAVDLLDKAEELADETATPWWRQTAALTQIASSAVALSDLERARRIVGEIAPSQRDRGADDLDGALGSTGAP